MNPNSTRCVDPIAMIKTTVATEVAFLLKNNDVGDDVTARILLNMIRAYDMPDAWWEGLDKQRSSSKTSVGISVKEWAKLFYNDPYSEHIKNEPRRCG